MKIYLKVNRESKSWGADVACEVEEETILDDLMQDEKIIQKQQIARAKSRKLAKDW